MAHCRLLTHSANGKQRCVQFCDPGIDRAATLYLQDDAALLKANSSLRKQDVTALAF